MSEAAAGVPAGTVVGGRGWRVREVDAEAVTLLQRRLGLLPTTARVLAGRGLVDPAEVEEFLDPGLARLHDPFLFSQMEPAVDRLRAALRSGERIVVHGDYDADGITATVLLVTVLRHLGADVEFILPHRIVDGYGLAPEGVDRAVAAGARVMVAVDCGITALAAAERARRAGVDLIIADHHLPRSELPDAFAILNPRCPGESYPEEDLAAVGIAFKLARGLLRRHAPHLSGIALLALVALGTVADVVSLTGENRVMTYHGLNGLTDAVNPGVRALMQVASVDPNAVSAADVGFRLAPRINAAGRLGHPDEAAELFLTRDEGRARLLADRLQRLNEQRRQLERRIFEEALGQRDWAAEPVVLAAGAGWHRGVIGIVAARLAERWRRPAFVLSIEEDEAYGSARSVPGVDVSALLAGADELLGEWGGHRQAAGFRLPATAIEPLREALARQAARQGPGEPDVGVCDDLLEARELTPALALELERLAPFGMGNPRPRFLCLDVRPEGPPERIGGEHLKWRVRGAGGDTEVVGWRLAHRIDELAALASFDLVARVRANRWGGRLRPQLEIEAIGP